MLGNEARGAAIDIRNAVDTRDRERDRCVRVRRQARACAARSANAADRSGRLCTAITRIIAITAAMFMHMILDRSHAAMVRLAQRHQFARIAAQWQCREQQDEH